VSALPQLLDRKTLATEYGFARSTVDAIFLALPVIKFPNHRKVYVRRTDVDALIASSTFAKDQVRA
jgi:hypothetical protein